MDVRGRSQGRLGAKHVHQRQTGVEQHGDFRLLLIVHCGKLIFAYVLVYLVHLYVLIDCRFRAATRVSRRTRCSPRYTFTSCYAR